MQTRPTMLDTPDLEDGSIRRRLSNVIAREDLDSPDEDAFSPACYLQNLARRHGVDFFSEPSSWREDRFQCAIQIAFRGELDRPAAAQDSADHLTSRWHNSWNKSPSENQPNRH